MTHFIIEMLDGRVRVVGCGTSKAYTQAGIAELDPAGRRDLRVVAADEWFLVPTL